MFLRYDKMCVTLLTELDDGRYVNVPAARRNDDRYVTFLQLDETTIGTWCFFATGRDNEPLFQGMTAQVSKHFRRNESVPYNVTRTDCLSVYVPQLIVPPLQVTIHDTFPRWSHMTTHIIRYISLRCSAPFANNWFALFWRWQCFCPLLDTCKRRVNIRNCLTPR